MKFLCPLATPSRITPRIRSGRTATIASSHAGVTAASDDAAARPRIDPPLGFTGTMRPAKPLAIRFLSTAPPALVSRSAAPAMATLVGRRMLAIRDGDLVIGP